MRIDWFLRTFCFCALPAALYVVIQGARAGMDVRDAMVGGVAIGLFSGLFMTVWLMLMRHVVSRFAGRLALLLKRVRGIPDLEVRERITLPVSPDRAVALCRAAVERVPGAHGIRADRSSVRGMAGVTWVGIGQRIECHVAAAEGGSQVEIIARPQYRLLGTGHHERRAHVERIRAYLRDHAPTPALAANTPLADEAPLHRRERVKTGLGPS